MRLERIIQVDSASSYVIFPVDLSFHCLKMGKCLGLVMDSCPLPALPSPIDAAIREPSGSFLAVPPQKSIKLLEQIFEKYDRERNGCISLPNMEPLFSIVNDDLSKEEFNQMIKSLDIDGNGAITFEELESATKQLDPGLHVEEMKKVFSVFDTDNDGVITAEELHQVLVRVGEEISLDRCRKMITAVDSKGETSVDFEDFLQLLQVNSA